MVIVKQQHDQKAKRQGCKHPFHIQLPEMKQPPAIRGGIERSRDGDARDLRVLESAGDMREAHPEERREDICVVCQEAAEQGAEDGAATEEFETVDGEEVEDGDCAAHEAGCVVWRAEFVDQCLDSFDCFVVVSVT